MKCKLFVLSAALILTIPAFAHHPFSSEYDSNKPLTVTGSVKSVNWTEPHVTFMVSESGDPAGEWKFDGASPATLDRREWSQSKMLKAGDTVTVYGYRALDGSMNASARSIHIADGRTLSISDPTEDGGPPAQNVSESSAPPVVFTRSSMKITLLVIAAGALIFAAFYFSRSRSKA